MVDPQISINKLPNTFYYWQKGIAKDIITGSRTFMKQLKGKQSYLYIHKIIALRKANQGIKIVGFGFNFSLVIN